MNIQKYIEIQTIMLNMALEINSLTAKLKTLQLIIDEEFKNNNGQ